MKRGQYDWKSFTVYGSDKAAAHAEAHKTAREQAPGGFRWYQLSECAFRQVDIRIEGRFTATYCTTKPGNGYARV